jgi:hypothetical protein
MEMLKVVGNPIEYLDTLKIPYSVRKGQSHDPLAPDIFYILIEYKDTTFTLRYHMIDGEWFYVQ